jgi:predicted nuclease of restriction endonuclease-like (RecB) superfamily
MTTKIIKKTNPQKDIFTKIKSLIPASRNQVVRAVNSAMVLTYYEIGRIIVENEQQGADKAKYGEQTLKELSEKLAQEFGKGFSSRNLSNMRSFYLCYSISQTVSAKSQKSGEMSRILDNNKFPKSNLSWSHYVFLIRLEEQERSFYEIEANQNNWSIRELERQFNSGLFQRLSLSRNKDEVKQLSQKGQIIEKPQDLIKEPYILEFLGLDEKASYTESKLEQEIINKIEDFLLELGKGFSFVGRQKRFSFDEEHFFVDLVFYNRLLRCFVLIDLKIGKLKHQDLGQMQMYVNYYDRFEKLEEEKPTIGIVLCYDKKDTLVEITLPKNSNIFAKEYKTYLPTKKELKEKMQEAVILNEKRKNKDD